jgi:ADP-heptose:LPS heptosyltransferase
MPKDPQALASEFLTELRTSGCYLRDNITRLAEMSVDQDERVASAATRCIFGSLVEPLCDRFEPSAVSLYNQIFAQLVHVCRGSNQGEELDRALSSFYFFTEGALVGRAESLRTVARLDPSRLNDLKRVVVLSRVTLGADVAISSLIIQRIRRACPTAEVVLVGGQKTAELFGGVPQLKFHPLSYTRAGTMLDRLRSWLEMVQALRRINMYLDEAEYLVIDPDSRLTQLGLLPVALGETYLFFPSREYAFMSDDSIADLTSQWLNDVLGIDAPTTPMVNLSQGDLDAARDLLAAMRRADNRPVVCINFGVGENPAKRVGDNFEKELARRLLHDGVRIILDKGAGAEESRRASTIIDHLSNAIPLTKVIEVDEQSLAGRSLADRIDADVVVWSGRIGLLAALIGRCDLYIGYDSAGQHIAAALGVPCIDVFAGFSSRRMLDRWRPTGNAETRVVVVEQQRSEQEVLLEVLSCAGELLEGRRK